MDKKSFFIFVFLVILLFFNLIYLYFFYFTKENTGYVAGIKNDFNIINSVLIGEHRFTLFGYTSPFAEVNFVGQGIADQTTADKNGYFEFKNRFSPFSPREACLSAKDQFGRISPPVCLPPFPVQYNAIIGPVIMPPTISLNKNSFFVGDQIILSGQTIPNTSVNLSIFTDNYKKKSGILRLSFIKNVEAFSIPKIKIFSDSKGNFSISLPSSSSQQYRLFTQANFKNTHSPNSLLLKVKVEPFWMIIIKFIKFIFDLIKPRLLEITIALEIIIILLYLKKMIFDHKNLKKEKSIVLYQSILPEIRPKNYLIKI